MFAHIQISVKDPVGMCAFYDLVLRTSNGGGPSIFLALARRVFFGSVRAGAGRSSSSECR
jgi:hypothetical protein